MRAPPRDRRNSAMIFAAALLLVPSVAYVGRSPPIGGASRPCVRHSPVRAAEAASEAEMVGEWVEDGLHGMPQSTSYSDAWLAPTADGGVVCVYKVTTAIHDKYGSDMCPSDAVRWEARPVLVSAGEGEPVDAPKSFFAQFPKAEYLVGQAKAIFPLSLVFGEIFGFCVNITRCMHLVSHSIACVYCCSGDDHLQQSVPQARRGIILQRGQEFNHRLQRLLLPVSATIFIARMCHARNGTCQFDAWTQLICVALH